MCSCSVCIALVCCALLWRGVGKKRVGWRCYLRPAPRSFSTGKSQLSVEKAFWWTTYYCMYQLLNAFFYELLLRSLDQLLIKFSTGYHAAKFVGRAFWWTTYNAKFTSVIQHSSIVRDGPQQKYRTTVSIARVERLRKTSLVDSHT